MTEPAPDDIVVELTVGVTAVVFKSDLWPGFPNANIASPGPSIPGMGLIAGRLEGTPTEPGLWLVPVNPGYGTPPTFDAWIKVIPDGPPPVTRVRAPLGMRLDDSVDIVTAEGGAFLITLDAHVGQATSGLSLDGTDVFVVNELRATVPPWSDLDWVNHRVIWRGESYFIDGPPLVRRKGGRDHHWTLRLTTQTA